MACCCCISCYCMCPWNTVCPWNTHFCPRKRFNRPILSCGQHLVFFVFGGGGFTNQPSLLSVFAPKFLVQGYKLFIVPQSRMTGIAQILFFLCSFEAMPDWLVAKSVTSLIVLLATFLRLSKTLDVDNEVQANIMHQVKTLATTVAET